MSIVLMNQLLEDAGLLSSELAARAMAGTRAAGDVVEQAQAIGLKAVDEAERLHREYTEAITAIQHAAERSGQAVEAVGQALESVTPQAQEAATSVTNLLTAASADTDHLGQERVRVYQELDAEAHKADAAFQALATQVAAFEEHVQAKVEESEEALKRIHAAVELFTTRANIAQQDLKLALEGIGGNGAHATSVVAHALDQMLAAVSAGMLKFCNDGVLAHNVTVAGLLQGYLDASKGDPEPDATYVGAAFDTVHNAVQAFEQVPEPTESVLQSVSVAIIGEAEKCVGGLTEAAQSLEQSHGVVTS